MAAKRPTLQLTAQPTGEPTHQPVQESTEQPAQTRTKPPNPASSVASGRLKPSAVTGQSVGYEPDWLEVITRLDRVRAKSLMQLDESLLASAVIPGCAAWAADTALLAALRSRGLRPRGLRTQVLAAVRIGVPSVVDSTTEQALVPEVTALSRVSAVTLLVTDRRAAYQLVDAKGAVVESVDEAGKAHWQLTLIPALTKVGWLICDVAVQP